MDLDCKDLFVYFADEKQPHLFEHFGSAVVQFQSEQLKIISLYDWLTHQVLQPTLIRQKWVIP